MSKMYDSHIWDKIADDLGVYDVLEHHKHPKPSTRLFHRRAWLRALQHISSEADGGIAIGPKALKRVYYIVQIYGRWQFITPEMGPQTEIKLMLSIAAANLTKEECIVAISNDYSRFLYDLPIWWRAYCAFIPRRFLRY